MPVDSVLPTGIRAIDGMLTVGRGQRVGIYGGAGVGKSILMGMIARNTEADINVIALIGERGREVGNFVRSVLGEEGLKRSVVVAATSDQPALMRIRGAFVAMAVAEYFRDQGKSVMLMMDSVTRMAMAQREVGMTVGEPPTTRGYTPSVFSMLPKLMERAGTSDQQGSITGFYTVLVEGDDMMEPITDATRAILDGHIVLSRELASQGHYPAIDILESISRLMVDIVPKAHQNVADALRELLAIYRENQTLINIGLYRKGTNPDIDIAIDYRNEILNFLRQEMMEKVEYEDLLTHLYEIFPDIANEEI
jgi:flagellum-specific ATP synthase